MTTESLEELRERLLRQQSVQQMIKVRAYEIYEMRGGRPGGEAQDWFHAEGEVLAFLIADESRFADLNEAQGMGASTKPVSQEKATAAKKSKSRDASDKQRSQKRAAEKRLKKSTGSESKPKRARKKP